MTLRSVKREGPATRMWRKEDICHALTTAAFTSSCQAKLGALCFGPPRHHCLQPPHVMEDCTDFASFHLTWQHSREHIWMLCLDLWILCLTGLQASGSMCPINANRRWPLVVACRPVSPHSSRLLGLALRLSRSCPSMPPGNSRRGWHLRMKPCVEYFLYVSPLYFPVAFSLLFRWFSIPGYHPVAFPHLGSVFFVACIPHSFLLWTLISQCETQLTSDGTREISF